MPGVQNMQAMDIGGYSPVERAFDAGIELHAKREARLGFIRDCVGSNLPDSDETDMKAKIAAPCPMSLVAELVGHASLGQKRAAGTDDQKNGDYEGGDYTIASRINQGNCPFYEVLT